MSTQDEQPNQHRAPEKQNSHGIHVKNVVSEQNAEEAERCAGAAKCKVQLLLGAIGGAQQKKKDSRHDNVDGQQNQPRDCLRPIQSKRPGVRNRGLNSRDGKKEDRVDERDHGTLAAIQNGKRFHDVFKIMPDDRTLTL